MCVDVAIINLARFGDLLQTQAIIDDLHEAGHKVGLICLNNFAAALPLLRNVEKSWTLNGAALLARLDSAWPLALQAITDFVAQIHAQSNLRQIINLSPTLPGRLLARLLATPDTKTLGFDLDEFGYRLNHGLWGVFFAVGSALRAYSPFNLADIFRRLAIDLTGRPRGTFLLKAPQTDWARKFLAGEAAAFATPPAGFVAFQLGASADFRRWPVEHFRELGQIIWQETGLVPILLGATGEASLGEEYGKNAAHPFINAIGRTDPVQLAALLKEARLLVTNDTGTMHLAAGLEVSILAFFLATAQPWDTGPLMPGSICLEPAVACHPCPFNQACERDYICARQISPQTAAYYAFMQLGAKAPLAAAPVRGEAVAWRTKQEEDGTTGLERISEDAPGQKELWLAWLREFWRQLLNQLEKADSPAAMPEGGYAHLPRPAAADSLAATLNKAATLLGAVAESARLAIVKPQMGKLFLKNSQRLQTLLDSSENMEALAAFWREFSLNQGADIRVFASQCAQIAAHLRVLSEAMEAA